MVELKSTLRSLGGGLDLEPTFANSQVCLGSATPVTYLDIGRPQIPTYELGCGRVVSLKRRDSSNSLRRRLFRPMTVSEANWPSRTAGAALGFTPDASLMHFRLSPAIA